MVDKIHFIDYKKLKDLEINFTSGLNILAGTNGTCKSTILHVISNSYQKEIQKGNVNEQCLKVISKINDKYNPKIESLARETEGDFKGKGTFFETYYSNGTSLQFRRHESTKENGKNRYAVKPYYKVKGETLPRMPIIYLGLQRLVNIGEIDDKNYNEENLRATLPEELEIERNKEYYRLTGYRVENPSTIKVKDVKNRLRFKSDKDGVDSNTISSGEDNLMIILNALFSLKYYYLSKIKANKNNKPESILLIDEIDATLHPHFQRELIKLFISFSSEYQIQMFFTTHSQFFIQECMGRKENIIYLRNNIETVSLMDNFSINDMSCELQLLDKDKFNNAFKIPVFTEDEESRFILERLLNYYKSINSKLIAPLNCFYILKCTISCDALKTIFNDKITGTIIHSICILDGDQDTKDKNCLNNSIISLPGKNSPEELLINYGKNISDNFYKSSKFSKQEFKFKVLDSIENFNYEQLNKQNQGESCKGDRREFYKKLFNDNLNIFDEIIDYWIIDENNKKEIDYFRDNLKILFKKQAKNNGISPDLWE